MNFISVYEDRLLITQLNCADKQTLIAYITNSMKDSRLSAITRRTATQDTPCTKQKPIFHFCYLQKPATRPSPDPD